MVTGFRQHCLEEGGVKVGLARNLLRSLFQALFFYFVKCKVVNHLVRGERGAEYFGHKL